MKKVLVLTAAALAMAIGAAHAEGDPAAGEKVFKKCMACHAVGPGAKNKAGPALNGVVGSVIGSHPDDYQFSKALKDLGAAGKVWDDANLTAWLTSPKAFAPGTKMAFAGLKNPKEIEDVIAYLKTFE